MESRPAPVAQSPKQAGDIRTRWAWVEPSVWTDRMLMALENGVKGGVWFSLIDKVYSEQNVRSAYEQVRRNHGGAGADNETVEGYGVRLEDNLARLRRELQQETYRPQPIRRTWIPKPGKPREAPSGNSNGT